MKKIAFFLILIVFAGISCRKDVSSHQPTVYSTADSADFYNYYRQVVELEYKLNEQAEQNQGTGKMQVFRLAIPLESNGLPSQYETLRSLIAEKCWHDLQESDSRIFLYDLEYGGINADRSKVLVNIAVIAMQHVSRKSRQLYLKDLDFCTMHESFYTFGEAEGCIDTILNFCQGGAPFPVHDVKLMEFKIDSYLADSIPDFASKYYEDKSLYSSVNASGFGFYKQDLESQFASVQSMIKKSAPDSYLIPPYYDQSGKRIENRKFSIRMTARPYFAQYSLHSKTVKGNTYRWYEVKQVYFSGNRFVFDTEKVLPPEVKENHEDYQGL